MKEFTFPWALLGLDVSLSVPSAIYTWCRAGLRDTGVKDEGFTRSGSHQDLNSELLQLESSTPPTELKENSC